MKKLYKKITIQINGYNLRIISEDTKLEVSDCYDSYNELMGTICMVVNEIWKR